MFQGGEEKDTGTVVSGARRPRMGGHILSIRLWGVRHLPMGGHILSTRNGQGQREGGVGSDMPLPLSVRGRASQGKAVMFLMKMVGPGA